MKIAVSGLTPATVSRDIEAYVAARQAELLPSGEASKDGRRFSWCGEILDFLTEGLAERFAAKGITFTDAFPGPLRLMDEDQQPNGQHVQILDRRPAPWLSRRQDLHLFFSST